MEVTALGLHLHLGYLCSFLLVAFGFAFWMGRVLGRVAKIPPDEMAEQMDPIDYGIADLSRATKPPSLPAPGYEPLLSSPPPVPMWRTWISRPTDAEIASAVPPGARVTKTQSGPYGTLVTYELEPIGDGCDGKQYSVLTTIGGADLEVLVTAPSPHEAVRKAQSTPITRWTLLEDDYDHPFIDTVSEGSDGRAFGVEYEYDEAGMECGFRLFDSDTGEELRS